MIINVGQGGASTADKVEYDNSTSGLQANNVQGAVDELSQKLNTFSFRVNEQTGKAEKSVNNGETWENFSSGGVYYLGTGTSFNIKSKFPNDYQNFTVDNFIAPEVSASQASGYFNGQSEYYCRASGFTITKSYNVTTGVFSLSGNRQTISGRWGGASPNSATQTINNLKVYLVIGEIEPV